MEIRLNKFLAERLGVSRREADELIVTGKITIDGKPAILGARVDKSNKVCYNNKTVPFANDFLYLAFHKPVGYVCSRRAQGNAPTLYELLPEKYQKLKTVGRLDKDSSGLILLTNDGDFAYQMTHPKFRKTKVYEVELNRPLEPLHQQMISDYGVMLDDGPSQFKVLKMLATPLSRGFRSAAARGLAPAARGDGHTAKTSFTSTGDAAWGTPSRAPARMGENAAAGPVEQYMVFLTEGRNRQIRRTFAALGYRVTKLHRTQFGKYELGDLKPGETAEII